MNNVVEIARKAKKASAVLSRLSSAQKNEALQAIAEQLLEHAEEIQAANAKDLEAAAVQVESGKMPESIFSRLKLDSSKFKEMVAGVEQVARLEEPVGKVTLATQLDEGLELYRVTCPIGVVGVIFEARPDALVQIASLCLKSGNAVLLKGGKEADQTNRVLFKILRNAAIQNGVPPDAMVLLESREEVMDLLKAEGVVDLIIPRGSNALVRFIQENTLIPVLGHAEGICHIYIDEQADLPKAVKISVDAKVQYPAACNAVETILVHHSIASSYLPQVIDEFRNRKVEVRCDPKSIQDFHLQRVSKATDQDWKTEYGDMVVSIKTVESLEEAISHINTFGSHHTESIVTEDKKVFERFFAEVDSAGIFLNASTRFSDGFRYGFGAEVGISTGKLHPRGPVGLDGLVTYKYKLLGKGHIVGTYTGPNAKPFTHKPLS